MPSYSGVANGTILPARFVRLDTTAMGKIVQCGTGEKPYGVSHMGTRNPGSGTTGSVINDDGNAALAGETLPVFGPPDKDVSLQLGGTVTRGDSLKSDSVGRGVTTTSTGDWVGAIALASGTINQLVPVQIVAPGQY